MGIAILDWQQYWPQYYDRSVDNLICHTWILHAYIYVPSIIRHLRWYGADPY